MTSHVHNTTDKYYPHKEMYMFNDRSTCVQQLGLKKKRKIKKRQDKNYSIVRASSSVTILKFISAGD